MKKTERFPDIKPLAAALQFLTILPVPVKTEKKDLENALPWFPAAGLVIGAAAAIVLVVARFSGIPPVMAGLLGVLALSGMNGFFHLDGVADTADGFWSARPKEQILEIMRDSRIGTMGVTGLFFILGLKCSALSAMDPGTGWRALIIAAAAARAAQVLTMGLIPYARGKGGLASVFLENRPPSHMVIVSVSGLLIATLFGGIAGIGALFTAAAAIFVFNGFCIKKIGGMTGDTLGALTEITETAVLCSMAVMLP